MDMIAERLDSEKGELWHVKTLYFSDYWWRVNRHVPFCNRFLRSDGYAVRISIGYGFTEVFAFIDDNLIVTEGTKNEHMAKVREKLKTLVAANLQMKATSVSFHKAKLSGLDLN